MMRRTLWSLSVAALAMAGCQGGLSQEEQLVGEATSYLTNADETGDLGTEALAAESPAEAETLAGDASVLPSMPPDADGVCDFGARRQRVLEMYDADGNGRLDATERQQLKSDLEARVGHPIAVRFGILHRVKVLKRVKWAFDENGDGVLSSDERTALVDAMEARCERRRAAILERFDADHDGTLSPAERQAAKDALKARLQALREAVLTKYDTNDNGVLDDGERLALRNDLIAEFQAKKAALMTQFDADGDGHLNDAEVLALKQAIQRRIAEGRDAE